MEWGEPRGLGMEGIDICNRAADEVRVVGPESSLPMQQEADGWPGRFLAKRLCKDVAAADCLPKRGSKYSRARFC